jgi:hypothetical protein
MSGQPQTAPLSQVALLPYIRRLVATGFDFPAVLHGFFGDDWAQGIGPLHEMERRNYLFAAKSDNWLTVKAAYDMDDGQTIPFLRPLQNASEKEIQGAETTWSEWLAMQDWMLGPRAPEVRGTAGVSGAGIAGVTGLAGSGPATTAAAASTTPASGGGRVKEEQAPQVDDRMVVGEAGGDVTVKTEQV